MRSVERPITKPNVSVSLVDSSLPSLTGIEHHDSVQHVEAIVQASDGLEVARHGLNLQQEHRRGNVHAIRYRQGAVFDAVRPGKEIENGNGGSR